MRPFWNKIVARAGVQLTTLPSAAALGTDASGNIVAAASAGSGPFVGQVVQAAFSPGAPWLLCDGAAVTVASGKTTLRNGLIAAGNPFGVSGTDPLLPNLKGRVQVGRDAAQTEFNTVGKTGGAKTHLLAAAESGVNGSGSTTSSGGGMTGAMDRSPNHTHGMDYAGGGGATAYGEALVGNGAGGGTFPASNIMGAAGVDHLHSTPNHSHPLTARNADSAHNNLQPFVVIDSYIYAG